MKDNTLTFPNMYRHHMFSFKFIPQYCSERVHLTQPNSEVGYSSELEGSELGTSRHFLEVYL